MKPYIIGNMVIGYIAKHDMAILLFMLIMSKQIAMYFQTERSHVHLKMSMGAFTRGIKSGCSWQYSHENFLLYVRRLQFFSQFV